DCIKSLCKRRLLFGYGEHDVVLLLGGVNLGGGLKGGCLQLWVLLRSIPGLGVGEYGSVQASGLEIGEHAGFRLVDLHVARTEGGLDVLVPQVALNNSDALAV